MNLLELRECLRSLVAAGVMDIATAVKIMRERFALTDLGALDMLRRTDV